MKVRQTGLFIPIKRSKLLIDATSPHLQNHNVKIVLKPYITDEIAEIFLSPLPDGIPDFRIAKVIKLNLFYNSFKFIWFVYYIISLKSQS